MTGSRFHFLNWFLLLITMLLACTVQTTVWYQLIGSVAAPLLWLNVVLYIVLYRRRTEAILINYALAIIIAPFTSMALGQLWALLLIVTFAVSTAKRRIFWPGTKYFVITSFGITLVYQLSSSLISHFFDANPVGWSLFPRTLELLFTPLWAAPVYWFMSFLDRVSEKEPLPERGVGV